MVPKRVKENLTLVDIVFDLFTSCSGSQGRGRSFSSLRRSVVRPRRLPPRPQPKDVEDLPAMATLLSVKDETRVGTVAPPLLRLFEITFIRVKVIYWVPKGENVISVSLSLLVYIPRKVTSRPFKLLRG